ncbi:uncharacterized protein LOC128681130 isoform X2 [Plodia interpunctella]|uniref:uncharacterized protein LOC128681130 isoform X2 n=1 Tax=Plodia interpunctella TaxID=58824 RepID=UPI002368446B|nr:uncharacterized protein LOC128681130 isoform X2 [Plodia interpunctella]
MIRWLLFCCALVLAEENSTDSSNETLRKALIPKSWTPPFLNPKFNQRTTRVRYYLSKQYNDSLKFTTTPSYHTKAVTTPKGVAKYDYDIVKAVRQDFMMGPRKPVARNEAPKNTDNAYEFEHINETLARTGKWQEYRDRTDREKIINHPDWQGRLNRIAAWLRAIRIEQDEKDRIKFSYRKSGKNFTDLFSLSDAGDNSTNLFPFSEARKNSTDLDTRRVSNNHCTNDFHYYLFY